MLKRLLLIGAVLGAGWLPATEGVSEMAIQLFGKEEAPKRVATGAVFIDGLYVKGPYEVSREGNVILINGRVASRFKVEAKAAAEAAAQAAAEAAAKAAAEKADAAASAEGAVSDEAGATIGSDPTPTLEDSGPAPAAKRPSAIEQRLAKRGAGGIEARLAAQRKAKNLQQQSAKGSFNTEASGGAPTALFEEADYTYTPPSRPEPKAVPYARPGARKSMTQRLADAKEADAKQEAKRVAAAKQPEADDAADEIATEAFDDLTEAEIDAYTKRFAQRRAVLEKILEGDNLLLLVSTGSSAQYKNRAMMWRFVSQLDALCAAPTASKLLDAWGRTLPRAYLQRIFDNRASNSDAMRTLILRVRRQAREAKERADNRI